MVRGIEFVTYLALKKKKKEDPQLYAITLLGTDIDDVALRRLRGKALKLVVDVADVVPAREALISEVNERLRNIEEFINKEEGNNE